MSIKTTEYGTVAKALHWIIAAAIVTQFVIGWRMPHVRRGELPEVMMNFHFSLGVVILTLIVIRLAWRVTHPVALDPSLSRFQRLGAETVHWLLYFLVLVTTVTGWAYASARGWRITFFGLFPWPSIVEKGSILGRTIGRLHDILTWVVLAFVLIHVLIAFAHLVLFRDRVMQRMLWRR
jgi:cytochrome b561